MADQRNPVLRVLAEHLPARSTSRGMITRRGIALVLGLVVLLAASTLGLNDILATLIALGAVLLWLWFGPPSRGSSG